MSIKTFQSKWIGSFICVVMLYNAQSFATGNGTTAYNKSSDPNALYGLCSPGGSALQTKIGHLAFLGETLTDVLAITVLDCGGTSEGGSPEKVSCPADSPYAYCINTGNDGIGQDVSFGVLKFDAKTDPNGIYTSCPSGAQLKTKLSLIGGDRRLIKGIVTLAWTAAQ